MREALKFGPEFAVIAGPASTHIGVARALAEAGVHLLVEKPLSDSLSGVDEFLEICERQDIRLMVGFSLRFDPVVVRLRDEIQSGRIGRVLSLRAEVGQYLPDWRPDADYRQTVSACRSLGGGVLLELSHELDLARWLCGEVQSVAAQARNTGALEIDVEDTAEILLEFESGALGSVHLDMLRRPPARKCEVVGEKGVLSLDLLAGRLTLAEAEGEARIELLHRQAENRNAVYLRELEHFLECIASGSAPRVGGHDGRAALALSLAARDSADSGKWMTP